jgi:hypothetical protein
MSEATHTQLVERLDTVLNEQDRALAALRTAATRFAQADSDYRGAKARAFLRHSVKDDRGKTPTVDHIKALVDEECEAARFEQRMAQAEYDTEIEVVRSLRTTVSALQTKINHDKALAELAR